MNVTAITTEMGMTKGAISKICTKLFQKQFVEKMQMLDNQKEIFFRLTESGNEIYKAHDKLHKQAEEAATVRWIYKRRIRFYSKVYKGCFFLFRNIIRRKSSLFQAF